MTGMLTALVGGRSIENPSTPLSAIDESDALWSTLTGGATTATGVTVNRKAALTYSAFWRGVNLISRDVGKLPLVVYRRLDNGGRERQADHPAYRLLHRRPNEIMTPMAFRQTLQAHAMSTGNGYALIERDGAARPQNLLILDPAKTYPIRENGQLWYVTRVGSELRKFRPADVLHIRGLGYDGLIGYSVIEYAKETLGLGLGVRKYGAIFFKNGAALNVVIEHPGTLGDPERANLKASWAAMHAGLDNAHRTAVLEEGMKAHVLSIDARKAQLMELRQFEIREIANFMGLPPHKLGDTTRTAFASLEQENQSYLDDALDPWLVTWEQECGAKLLTDDEREDESHFVEFVREAVIRVDHQTMIEGMVNEVNNGLLSPDEARAIRNRPPYPKGLGQLFRKPENIGVIDDEPDDGNGDGNTPDGGQPDSPPPPANPDDDEEQNKLRAHRLLLIDAVRRMHKRVGVQAQRAAKKPDGFLDWLDGGLTRHRKVFVDAVAPVLRAIGSITGAAGDTEAVADHYFELARAGLLTTAECRPDELADAVGRWVTESARKVPSRVADGVIRRQSMYSQAAA